MSEEAAVVECTQEMEATSLPINAYEEVPSSSNEQQEENNQNEEGKTNEEGKSAENPQKEHETVIEIDEDKGAEETGLKNNTENHLPPPPPQNGLRANVRLLNDYLICPICKGYFRDAYTIPECLHTCK